MRTHTHTHTHLNLPRAQMWFTFTLTEQSKFFGYPLCLLGICCPRLLNGGFHAWLCGRTLRSSQFPVPPHRTRPARLPSCLSTGRSTVSCRAPEKTCTRDLCFLAKQHQSTPGNTELVTRELLWRGVNGPRYVFCQGTERGMM